jgi:cell cycle sensor histidine kinase DivJ
VSAFGNLKILCKPAPYMPAAARLRLFRESRIVSGAVMLGLFPLLAFASHESAAVIGALVLAALLPAVVAIECRRPALIDRAAAFHVLITAAVATGASMRGLPAVAALLLLTLAAIEALIVARGSGRLRSLAAFAAGTAGILTAAGLSDPAAHAPGVGMAGSLTVAVLAVAGAGVLIHGLARMLRHEIANARHDRLLSSEIEAVVSETVLALDKSGVVSRVSVNAPRVLGLPQSALLGRGLVDLALVADRPVLLTACADALDFVAPRKTRFRLRANLDDTRPCYRWAELSLQASAIPGVIIGSLRDVSADVAEEERANASAAEAEAAKAARSAFLATVSHELRTPLNAIIGFSDILANPATTPVDADRTRDYARMVNAAGQDLMRMVSAMLDLTRMQAGIYDFRKEERDVASLVDAVLEAFRQEPEGRREAFAFRAETRMMTAEVDPKALRSALFELFSNAAKFGRGRGVDVSVVDGGPGVAIVVRDRGVGILEEQLKLLGRHFARLDEGLGRETSGIGLGLALVHGIMRLHGGRVSIASRPDEGTAVTLHLGSAEVQEPSNVLTIDTKRSAGRESKPSQKERRRA